MCIKTPSIFDLTDCSIVVPVHIDSKERLEHLRGLYAYFNRYFQGHELIVVEQIQSSEVFSTAKVSNIGASAVSTPFFCKYDADAFIHPKALFDAFQRLKQESNKACILPYNGISVTIQNPLREELLQSQITEELPLITYEELDRFSHENFRVKNDLSTGLIHCFRTSTFKKLGGYNEEFIGWGYEDDEILYRFQKLANVSYLEGYNAFHFDHPRSIGDLAQSLKNQFRSLLVKNMDPDDLRDYIGTWSRFTRARNCAR